MRLALELTGVVIWVWAVIVIHGWLTSITKQREEQ